ncbi:MAG: hypothetical protein ACKO8I_19405 [Cyanobacteriota bacterium]
MVLVLDPHQDVHVAEQHLEEALTAPPVNLDALGSLGGDGTADAVGWRALSGPARAVRLNSDREFGAAWVRINAERPADLVALRTVVSRVLPICPVEVVRERARTPDVWPGSLVMLMVATGRPVTEDDLNILKAALRVPDVRVRVAAATAAALARTPALVGALSEAASNETDADALRALEYAIAGCGGE